MAPPSGQRQSANVKMEVVIFAFPHETARLKAVSDGDHHNTGTLINVQQQGEGQTLSGDVIHTRAHVT